MGAKMMPMAKKRGRTVLGVRMGLEEAVRRQQRVPRYQSVVERHTATLLIAAAERRYLSIGNRKTVSRHARAHPIDPRRPRRPRRDPRQMCSGWSAREGGLLGGRRLFVLVSTLPSFDPPC